MNTIIERFISIQQIMGSLGAQVSQYNWMLTDVDGNEELWIKSPQIQHPATVCEVILWDLSYVLLLSHNHELTERFRKAYPDWRSLEEYNRTMGLY